MRPDDPPTPGTGEHDPALAERGRALVAAAVADVRAPLGLRERLEDQRARAAPARRRRRLGLATGAAASLAAVVAAVVLVLPGGSPGAPSIGEAATLGARAASGPAPAIDPARPRVLRAGVEGTRFPAWRDVAWRATGARRDHIGDRTATTVFYRARNGQRVGYTIVAGRPLGTLSGARRRAEYGTEVQAVRRDGRTIVTWERDGHTCILNAPAAFPVDPLVRLASGEAPA